MDLNTANKLRTQMKNRLTTLLKQRTAAVVRAKVKAVEFVDESREAFPEEFGVVAKDDAVSKLLDSLGVPQEERSYESNVMTPAENLVATEDEVDVEVGE